MSVFAGEDNIPTTAWSDPPYLKPKIMMFSMGLLMQQAGCAVNARMVLLNHYIMLGR